MGKRRRRTSLIRGGRAPEDQARSILSNIIHSPPGEAHLVAKLQHPGDVRFKHVGLGGGGLATGAVDS